MKSNMGGGKGSKFSYPRTSSELDAANAKAHCPHGKNIPAQTEAGADALKAGHRKVSSHGMLSQPKSLPGAQSSPLDGDMDVPYSR